MDRPMTLEELWVLPGVKPAAGVFGLVLLVLIWSRTGAVFVKWIVILVALSIVLMRWNNTIRPWLFGR